MAQAYINSGKIADIADTRLIGERVTPLLLTVCWSEPGGRNVPLGWAGRPGRDGELGAGNGSVAPADEVTGANLRHS